MSRRIAVIAAHPDDEVLGCGGTMARHVRLGDEVHVVFMADGVGARNVQGTMSVAIRRRAETAEEACRLLGARPPRFLGFPDNRMDSVPLLDVVQRLEEILEELRPVRDLFHHAGDLNIDHRLTHQAVMTACRPLPGQCVREIYSFEVLSSTEWSGVTPCNVFAPNRFVDISTTLDSKITALSAYGEEIRQFPHSRSVEAAGALARYRGASVGVSAAEAFQVERLLVADG